MGNLPELVAWFKCLLDQPTARRVWIAEEQGRPVGYVLAISNHRRRGIGRALILKAIAEARAEGIQRVEAASWSFNEETHEVFRRLGFAPKTVRFELDAPA